MERTSQKNWDRENMTTVCCRITRKKQEEFREACTRLNTNMNAVLLSAVNQTIEAAKEKSGK